MTEKYPRLIPFENILNFRDLGGYAARDGRTLAWRRIFRSGEMHLMTPRDVTKLKDELRITSVIDLRSTRRLEQTGAGPLHEVGIQHFHVPLTIDSDVPVETMKERYRDFSNMGEVYLYRVKHKDFAKRIVEALEIIAGPDNLPLVFHCNAGKDRSGILSAILLSVLGVSDDDIIRDYTLTGQYMKEFIDRWDNDPVTADVHKNLPPYDLVADTESMVLLLSTLKKDYSSVKGYLKAHGGEPSLFQSLETALLIQDNK